MRRIKYFKLKFSIPNLKKHRKWIGKETESWDVTHKNIRESVWKDIKEKVNLVRYMRFLPSLIEPNVHEIEDALDLDEKGDHILVIAGSGGGIARVLARAKRHYVEFTDGNIEAVENIRRSKLGIIARRESAEEVSAKQVGRRPVIASVEPLPIMRNPDSAFLTILRGMSIGRSIVFLERLPKERSWSVTEHFLESIRNILKEEYNAEASCKTTRFTDENKKLRDAYKTANIPNKHAFKVGIIKVPREANIKAWIDLNLVYHLQDKSKKEFKISDLAKKLGVNERDVIDSIARIRRLYGKLNESESGSKLERVVKGVITELKDREFKSRMQ